MTKPARRAPSDTWLRRVALRSQGLLGRRKLGTGLAGVEKALARLGYVQIDTISVVARAHHHTLFTRVGRYEQSMLNALVAKRRAFEYWSHAAAYLPITAYRFSLPMMRAIDRGELGFHTWRDPKVEAWVRDRIRAEGPLFTRDFEDKGGERAGWWDWKPAKRALERLYITGVLTCIERQGFQKRYELTERWLPSDIDTTAPSPREHADHVIDMGLAAHGFATRKTLPSFRRDGKVREAVRARTAELVHAGHLVECLCSNGERIVARPDLLEGSLPRAEDVVRILSPFDNSVIERDRLKSLFGFDYTIECYVPEAKRQFGYFALPLVFADRMVGRMDCKAHRQEGRFEIKALFVETDVAESFFPAFRDAVDEYAAYTGCDSVDVTSVTPARLGEPVRDLWR